VEPESGAVPATHGTRAVAIVLCGVR
jgi:hypothetical protein